MRRHRSTGYQPNLWLQSGHEWTLTMRSSTAGPSCSPESARNAVTLAKTNPELRTSAAGSV
jgi:hypothetical protein